jgi:hypothetical protein
LYSIKNFEKIAKIKQGVKIIRLSLSLLDEKLNEEFCRFILERKDISDPTKNHILKMISNRNKIDCKYNDLNNSENSS